MKCAEALILMSQVLDGEASHEEEQLLRFHLNGCASCRRAMILNRSISEKLAEIEEPEPPEDLLAAVQARLTAGAYDQSPLPKKAVGRAWRWKIAAAVPFAAALVFLLSHTGDERVSDYTYSHPDLAVTSDVATLYSPVPVVSYTRPTSVSTF